MTDEGSDLWGMGPKREKKRERAGWLAEKEGSRGDYSNFQSNGRASNEEFKRATESIKSSGIRWVGLSIATMGKKNSSQKITRRSWKCLCSLSAPVGTK